MSSCGQDRKVSAATVYEVNKLAVPPKRKYTNYSDDANLLRQFAALGCNPCLKKY